MSWPVGTPLDVDWIVAGTHPGLAITSAIPPGFAGYATIEIPPDVETCRRHEQILLDVLDQHGSGQRWWLGYLETGAADVVFPDVKRVTMYTGWNYVLVLAGPAQAATWRTGSSWPGRGELPDLMFAADRSWLVSRLWDDDWRCIGGPEPLIAELIAETELPTRGVSITDPDATPPGHTAH
jgi:hypothetical protein